MKEFDIQLFGGRGASYGIRKGGTYTYNEKGNNLTVNVVDVDKGNGKFLARISGTWSSGQTGSNSVVSVGLKSPLAKGMKRSNPDDEYLPF